MKLKIGADPEVFLFKDGNPVSAYGVIGGNKQQPLPVRNGAVQVDGMALEFNIDPANTELEFVYNIEDVLTQLRQMVDGQVLATPVASFGHEYIDAQPEEATELGCDPDYNGWTGAINARPDGTLGIRTGAGHVHIGWTEKADIRSESFLSMTRSAVKQLDFYLGLPSVLFDGCTERRQMYGKAGAYRPKTYGVEYRTLSNHWLNSETLIRLVYKNIHKAFDALINGNILHSKHGDIQNIINTSDRDAAYRIIKEEGISYV